MAHGYDTMMNPAIEELLDKTGSKFRLVSLSAMRSREITNYAVSYTHLTLPTILRV